MHMPTLWQIELGAWYSILFVWAVAALRAKEDKATEPLPARLFHIVYVGCAFALLFSSYVPFTVLRHRFVPVRTWFEWLAVALTYCGAGLAIWARLTLGGNWSARVNLKVGHELVHRGPYAYIRHPIYTGFLLAVLGTALVVGEWRGLLAILLAAVGQSLKAHREEQFMLAEFGQHYVQYRKQTGFLLPKLSHAGREISQPG